jgi:hypothetical protein
MTTSKEEFIRTFLPKEVEAINFAQIDLDITDLSIADVLRNINRTFPKNTRIRNSIESGQHAVGVLCKTELLYPIAGIFLIVTGNDVEIEIVAKNYIVIGIQEELITDDEGIQRIIDSITRYIVTSFHNSIAKFNDFYAKFVYDPTEMEFEDDDYMEELYQLYKRRKKREESNG